MAHNLARNPVQHISAPSDCAEGIARLEALTERIDERGFLVVMWYPFTFKNKKEGRWLVYEVVPKAATPVIVLAKGAKIAEDPPGSGCFLPDPAAPLRLDPAALTPNQKRIFETFGRYAYPFWVVQGNKGGHKLKNSNFEASLLKMKGKDPDAPMIGALPYAPVDGRTLEQLGEWLRKEDERNLLHLYERDPEIFEKEELEQVRQMRLEYAKWLDEKVEEILEETDVKRLAEGLRRDDAVASTDFDAKIASLTSTP